MSDRVVKKRFRIISWAWAAGLAAVLGFSCRSQTFSSKPSVQFVSLHATHLDSARMEQAVGFHIACTDCHEITALMAKPSTQWTHDACARCHSTEASQNGKSRLSMEQCQDCHRTLHGLGKSTYANVQVSFDHRRHRIDRQGNTISCEACHRRSGSLDPEPTPPVEKCISCHDDSDKTPTEQRMRMCGTCHQQEHLQIGTLAPRTHLPSLSRPPDHSPRFRLEHTAAARAADGECFRCHTFLSGSARDNCDECHQVMHPRDHMPAWTEYDHGKAAIYQPARCTTCHTQETCSNCHLSAPRSHFPLSSFGGKGHATRARQNPRACVVCHEPSQSCETGGCH